MAEGDALKAEIGYLAGLINRHKQGDGDDSSVRNHWNSPREHPYPRGRGRARVSRAWRGGRAHPPTHRNRSLVLNTLPPAATVPDDKVTPVATPQTASSTTWVSRQDRGQRQLINSAVFDQKTQERTKAIEETKQQRARERDAREKARMSRFLKTHQPTAGGRQVDEIMINDLRFRIVAGGGKLLRILDGASNARASPKRTKVGGVNFIRSRNGNLYREGIVKAQRRNGFIRKIHQPCKRFSSTGTCAKGDKCPFIHDANKVALCKDYLQKRNCPAGDSCDLSHDPTPERAPTCLHFVRGNCSKEDCRYAHVRVNPGANVCRPFATLGYCEKGAQCAEKHVHECPDYSNEGECHNKNCRLPHIDRAGKLRQKKESNTTTTTTLLSDQDSDVSSEEDDYDEIDSEDVDSDGLADEPMLMTADPALEGFPGQQDFLRL